MRSAPEYIVVSCRSLPGTELPRLIFIERDLFLSEMRIPRVLAR